MTNNAYKIVETADGSPSLEWLASNEIMHNWQGAFAETIAIYAPAIEESIELTGKAKVLSVGLGIAYNEILTASICLAKKIKKVELLSFEANESLREYWLSWLKDEENILSASYDKVIQLCADKYSVSPSAVKNFLIESYQKEEALLEHRLSASTVLPQKYNCVLYDPFSARTNPECWEESFLELFFTQACEKQCLVSTYAAKGSLTRTLKKLNFLVDTPEGFGGKRNRTFAIRK